jgi:hypothetical protein
MQGLVGMGLGMMNGTSINRFGGALQGYQTGVGLDQRAAAQAEAIREHNLTNALAQRRQALAEAPQLIKTGVSRYTGNITYGLYDPLHPERGITAGAAGGAAGGPASFEQMEPNYNEEGKDEDFMNALRKQDPLGAEGALAVSEGRAGGTGATLQKNLLLAERYNRNFHQADYQTMLQTGKSFAPGGKDADVVRRMDQATDHAIKIWNLIPKVAMSDMGGFAGNVYNPLAAGVMGSRTDTAGKEYQAAKGKYDELAQGLSNELVAAAKATGGTGEEARRHVERLTSARSGPEMRGAVQGAMAYLDGLANAMERKRAEGMKSQYRGGRQLMAPESRQRMETIENHVEGLPASPQTPTSPTTQEKYPNAPGVHERGPMGTHPVGPIPARPASVPAGSQYSRSRHQWRDSQGHLYDEKGAPAK